MIADRGWARLTPFEIGLPGPDFADQAFGAIRAEADERGTDTTDPGRFVQLGEVGRAIRELQGEDRGADVIQRLGSFLFHTFHFHEAGRPLLLLETAAARRVVEPGFSGRWKGELPAPAGYLQLPRHLFWADGGGDTPEPVDGAFWMAAAGGTLSLLLATGLRSGRPGLSLVEVPPVERSGLEGLISERIRAEDPDFETTLPGGNLDGLYSVTTLGEALKLVARVFALLADAPEVLGPEERASRETATDHGSLPPTALPFRRIALPLDARSDEASDAPDAASDVTGAG